MKDWSQHVTNEIHGKNCLYFQSIKTQGYFKVGRSDVILLQVSPEAFLGPWTFTSSEEFCQPESVYQGDEINIGIYAKLLCWKKAIHPHWIHEKLRNAYSSLPYT